MGELPNLVHNEALRTTLIGKGVLQGEMLRIQSHFRGLLEESKRVAAREREKRAQALVKRRREAATTPSEAEAGTQAQAQAQAEAGTQAEAQAQAEAGTQAEAQAQAEADTQAEAQAQAEADTQAVGAGVSSGKGGDSGIGVGISAGKGGDSGGARAGGGVDASAGIDATLTPLSDEQKAVVHEALTGKNLLVYGGAGVGKSLVVRHLDAKLNEGDKVLVVTAFTGCAAIIVHGTTLHSFSGIGLCEGSKEELAKKAFDNVNTRRRWLETNTVVIDEVSMMDDCLLEIIDHVARVCRRVDEPMGGMQVIMVGDHFQLPPVVKEGKEVLLAFEGHTWKSLQLKPMHLEQVWRQADSGEFGKLLQELRVGICSERSMELLQGCVRPRKMVEGAEDVKPTKLFPRLDEVNAENKREFAMLNTEIVEYNSEDRATCTTTPACLGNRLKDLKAPGTLQLSIGTQVMLLVNKDLPKGLGNGARGIVVDFVPTQQWVPECHHKGAPDMTNWLKQHTTLPVVRFLCAPTENIIIGPHIWDVLMGNGVQGKAYRVQLPMMHAWAFSIHKAQGMTLDYARVSIDKCFAFGQAYVAISRVRRLEDLELDVFNPQCIFADPRVREYYKSLAL
eukprot:CAMPEP_0198228644 /NCGR_PEP_ID=MMETSP1445-20131203/113702_1 /TAXON_ID=36898 /ORGANISM="Pyramimonas sp., Strain CCMP2087" /LENGTH=619 /DNA_ID=CAMNT_0043909057 /DNA_START=1277 /DNA_END=3136 /DNA_ORIENTATION=-